MGMIRSLAKKTFKVAVIYASKQVVSKVAGKMAEVLAKRKLK